ncbi:MAG TPA: hypothetical protein VG944_00530 [Fimbriimonas sp.]|nr:hypothetical protein [Fimbriimonas sp.]
MKTVALRAVKGGAALMILLCLGCGRHGASQPVRTAAVEAPPDPQAQLYQKLRTADYQADGAIQELQDAEDGAKKLAPAAGGEAKEALLSVADLVNGAGESLSDYTDVSDTLADYKKDFAAQEDHRHKNIEVCIASLGNVQDASDILGVLLKNVPTERKEALNDIAGSVSEAENDLEDAIRSMGGKVPDEDSGDDQPSPGN